CERNAPRGAARVERRARAAGTRLRDRTRRPARVARARRPRPAARARPGRRHRLLLLPRDLGDARCARQLPALRRLAALGAGGGRPLTRAAALLAVLAAVCACAAGAGRADDQRDLSAYTGLATWVDLYDPHVLA